MQNGLSQENLYINDFHRQSSMAAQREVQIMSLQPYSREQKLHQIASLRRSGVSKEKSNAERSKKNVYNFGQKPSVAGLTTPRRRLTRYWGVKLQAAEKLMYMTTEARWLKLSVLITLSCQFWH